MQTTELSVGKQGRIVIPTALRRQLAIEPGAQLIAWVENGRLIMETKQQLWQSLRQACGDPGVGSATEELIRQRRVDAEQENQ
jgi:AbrB family looped-hinge helix DNA binding protein